MGYGTTHVELEKMIYYLNYVNETIGSTFQSYASGSFFPYSTARKDKDFKLIMEAQAVRDATNPNLRVCYQPSSRPRELSASLILHPPSPLWYTAQLLGCSSTKKTCTNTTTGDSFPVEQLLGKLLNGTGMFCEAPGDAKSCLVYPYSELKDGSDAPATGSQWSDSVTLGDSGTVQMKFGLVTTSPGSAHQANVFMGGNGLVGMDASSDMKKALDIRSMTLHPKGGKAHIGTGEGAEAPPKEWTAGVASREGSNTSPCQHARLCTQNLR